MWSAVCLECPVVRFAVLLCLIAFFAGCADDEDGTGETPPELRGAYSLTITGSAREAGREAGVDLEGLVRHSVEEVLARLPHRGRVRVDVELDPARVIPELGVGGFTDPSDGTVFVHLDYPLRAGAERWVPAVVAHELHHSSRIRTGPGYGNSLGEALVTEGLADHFVEEVFPETPPEPWNNALSRGQEASLWKRAEPQLQIPGYDHQSWFFGGSGIPRWAGYTLGYRIVAAYLGEKRHASDAVGVEASTIIAPYTNGHAR